MNDFISLIVSPSGITTVGLLLDIAGVILLFFFGFPQPDLNRGVVVTIKGQPELSDEKAIKKRRHQTFSVLGLVLLVLGFVLQIVGTWVST